MERVRSIGRVGFGFVAAVILSTPLGVGQNVHVHARTGCDQNAGTSSAPVQTITQALSLASGMTPPVTIQVAGAFDSGAGVPIPYDELTGNPIHSPCSGPQGAEQFPLGMLSRVSLVWDVTNSDTATPTGPPVRPIVRRTGTTVTLPLVDFSSATYAPGSTPVTLSGLDVEYGLIGIHIPDQTGGTVKPVLTDLNVLDCQVGINATSSSGTVDFDLADSTLKVRANAPSFLSNPHLMDLFSSAGKTAAEVTNTTFEGEAPGFADVGVAMTAADDGTTEINVDSSRFVGGTSLMTPSGQGMRIGLRAGSTINSMNTSASLLATVTNSTFSYCGEDAVSTDLVGAVNVNGTGSSTAAIASNLFYGNWRTLGGSATTQAQVNAGVEQGRTLGLQVSENVFRTSPAHGILASNTNAALGGTAAAGQINATFTGNDIRGSHTDGIHVRADALVVAGTISGNAIFDVADNGIENYAISNGAARSYANASIVNNMIGYTSGHAIYNHANGTVASSFRTFATPPITHNSLAMPGGAALYNVAVGTAVQPLNVTNNILRYGYSGTGGYDIVSGTPGSLTGLTLNFNNFYNPPPSGTNNGYYTVSFASLAGRDLHIASGSYMRDLGTNSPPASPALDVDGDQRRIDLAGVPNGPSGFADLGADERTTP